MQTLLALVSRATGRRVLLSAASMLALGGAVQPAHATDVRIPFFECLVQAERVRHECELSGDFGERILCEFNYLNDLVACFSGVD